MAMFVQVLKGRVDDADALHVEFDRWVADVAPGATGWLGSTGGVTEEGTFVGFARFASLDAAQSNSERPDQSAWWERASRLFTSEVAFEEYTDVEVFMDGGSDDAGFVQFVQGRASDPDKLRAVEKELVRFVPETRPDIIGGVIGMHNDGTFTEAVYFTSEEPTRAGERSEPDLEVAELIRESHELTGKVDYYDLQHPWMYSPASPA